MKHKTLSQTTFLTARSLLLQLVSTLQGPFSSQAFYMLFYDLIYFGFELSPWQYTLHSQCSCKLRDLWCLGHQGSDILFGVPCRFCTQAKHNRKEFHIFRRSHNEFENLLLSSVIWKNKYIWVFNIIIWFVALQSMKWRKISVCFYLQF